MAVVAEMQDLQMYKLQNVSSKYLVMRNMILFYVLVIIECIDRNWFKYWVLVNVTFFSEGLVGLHSKPEMSFSW